MVLRLVNPPTNPSRNNPPQQVGIRSNDVTMRTQRFQFETNWKGLIFNFIFFLGGGVGWVSEESQVFFLAG